MGVLHMRTSTLFGAKKLRIFQNLWSVRTENDGGGELSQYGHISDKGGHFFSILSGRFLWTTPYCDERKNKGLPLRREKSNS